MERRPSGASFAFLPPGSAAPILPSPRVGTRLSSRWAGQPCVRRAHNDGAPSRIILKAKRRKEPIMILDRVAIAKGRFLRLSGLVLALTLLLLLSPTAALAVGTGSSESPDATIIRLGEDVRVFPTESVETVVAFGGNIIVEGKVRGNVIAFGGDIEVRDGAVVGDGMTAEDFAVISFPLITLLLVITVVGIFAAVPLALFIMPILVLAGYLAAAGILGQRLLRAVGSAEPGLIAITMVGVVILEVLALVPILGALLLGLVWLAGFGATVAALRDWGQKRREGRMASPAPTTNSGQGKVSVAP